MKRTLQCLCLLLIILILLNINPCARYTAIRRHFAEQQLRERFISFFHATWGNDCDQLIQMFDRSFRKNIVLVPDARQGMCKEQSQSIIPDMLSITKITMADNLQAAIVEFSVRHAHFPKPTDGTNRWIYEDGDWHILDPFLSGSTYQTFMDHFAASSPVNLTDATFSPY